MLFFDRNPPRNNGTPIGHPENTLDRLFVKLIPKTFETVQF